MFAYGGGHGFLCLAAWLGDESKGVERDPMDRGGQYVFHGAYAKHSRQASEAYTMERMHLLLFVAQTLAVVVRRLPPIGSIDTQIGTLLNDDFAKEMHKSYIVPIGIFGIRIRCVIVRKFSIKFAKNFAYCKDSLPHHIVN